MMQNLVSWRVCFFYSFSVGWIIFPARRQNMSAFLEFSCPIYWTKCIFSLHFFWFLFCFEICGLLAFYALHSDIYNEGSWCFVHGLMQAAVGGGMLPWFCLSIVLTCVFVGSSFGLWRWNACCLLPSCDCDLRWSTKIWRVRGYENSDCWTEVLRKFSKDQSFSNGLWEPSWGARVGQNKGWYLQAATEGPNEDWCLQANYLVLLFCYRGMKLGSFEEEFPDTHYSNVQVRAAIYMFSMFSISQNCSLLKRPIYQINIKVGITYRRRLRFWIHVNGLGLNMKTNKSKRFSMFQ